MSSERDMGLHIRRLSNLLKRKVFDVMPTGEEVPGAIQGRIIGYISEQKEDVFQRDLEQVFRIRRSTASRILKRMEEQDFIRRESVPRDARLKRLVLTEKTKAAQKTVKSRILQIEDILCEGLTEEEIDQFLTIAAKIEQNLS